LTEFYLSHDGITKVFSLETKELTHKNKEKT